MCAGAGVCRRRDHGAAVMPDGRVVLVGGVVEAGAAELATTVLIDPRSGDVDESIGDLLRARRSPTALALSDGTIVVVGGSAAGAFVSTVESLTIAGADRLTKPFIEGLTSRQQSAVQKVHLAP